MVWSWTSETVPNDVQISDMTEIDENQETVAVVVGGKLYIFERETREIRGVAENVDRPVSVMVDDRERPTWPDILGRPCWSLTEMGHCS